MKNKKLHSNCKVTIEDGEITFSCKKETHPGETTKKCSFRGWQGDRDSCIYALESTCCSIDAKRFSFASFQHEMILLIGRTSTELIQEENNEKS